MSTLTVIKSRLPSIWTLRYTDTYWINWINELLERLSGEGLMKDLDYTNGFVVVNDHWVTPPTRLRSILKIFNKAYPDLEYSFHETEGNIYLDSEVDGASNQESVTSFSAYLTTGISVNIDNIAADHYKDYLLVITAGTYAGNTYTISGNTESAGGVTALTFEHALSTALNGTKVTAGYLVGPDYYVMMRYKGGYTDISIVDDEVPIDDRYERRITDAWLRFKCEFNASRHSKETTLAAQYFENVMQQISSEMLRGSPVQPTGRAMPGMFNRTRYV